MTTACACASSPPSTTPARKGNAHLRTPSQAGRAANGRYLDALAPAARHGTAVSRVDRLCRPCVRGRQRHGAFSPLAARDLAIFRGVCAGQHTLARFANRGLARRLHPRPPATAPSAPAAAPPPAA